MKVYVIECGLYSDRMVYGVTLTEEKAKQVVAEIEKANESSKGTYDRFGYESPYYEEYDTDDCEEKAHNDLEVMWRVSFLNASYTIAESDADEEGFAERPDGAIDIWVEADTEDKALKIASERRAEYLAQKNNLT